jgi:DNA-binding MarR family transcriptional regulator
MFRVFSCCKPLTQSVPSCVELIDTGAVILIRLMATGTSPSRADMPTFSRGIKDRLAVWHQPQAIIAFASSQKRDFVKEKNPSQDRNGTSGTHKMATESVEPRVDVLRQTIVALVRRDGPDLSARQLGAFLTSYLEDEAQTVRALAAKLNVSKPAITRALDRLSEFDLVRRKTDPLDRRSVLVQRTISGTIFLRDLRGRLETPAAGLETGKIRRI